MKEWKNEKMTIRGSNRWQEIKYDAKGEPYVRYHNARIYLSEFLRGEFEQESALARIRFDGGFATSYFSGHLIKLSQDCDAAKVFYYFW